MAAAVILDRDWTLAAHAHAWPEFAAFMKRSLFEGGGFGGGDAATIALLLALGAYLRAAFAPPASRWQAYRPALGYIVVTALVLGLACVHPLKLVVARARPSLDAAAAFFGTSGVAWGKGSFPSGHTASAVSLLAFVYAAAGHWRAGWVKQLGLPLAYAGAIAFAASMGLARMMSFDHWLSDVVAALLLGWIIAHALYHHGLRVADQERRWKKKGAHPSLPRLWELRLAGALLGAAAVLAGLAVVWREPGFGRGGAVGLSMAGIVLAASLLKAAWSLRRRVVEDLVR